jgi:hypothetical protein
MDKKSIGSEKWVEQQVAEAREEYETLRKSIKNKKVKKIFEERCAELFDEEEPSSIDGKMEEGLSAACLAATEEEQEGGVKTDKKIVRPLLSRKKTLYEMFPKVDKKLLTSYYNIFKTIIVYNDHENEFHSAEKIMGLKQLFFIKHIVRNNIEPTRKDVCQVCLWLDIYLEAVRYGLLLKRREAFEYHLERMDFVLDYLNVVVEKYLEQKIFVVPKANKLFLKNIFMHCFIPDENPNVLEDIKIMLENGDIFEA